MRSSLLSKLFLSVALLSSVHVAHLCADAHAILCAIDNKPFGIHAESISGMIMLCQNMSAMLHGYGNKNLDSKKREPNCFFKGKPSSPIQLAQMHIDTKDTQAKYEIDAHLEHCKAWFVEETRDFLQEAREIKNFLVRFIQEWTTRNNRHDSLLLQWLDCEGDEIEAFEQLVDNMATFNQFCKDLSGLMHELMLNCPLACQAWEKQTGQTLPWNKKK